ARLDELASQLGLPVRVIAHDEEPETGEPTAGQAPSAPGAASSLAQRSGLQPVELDGGSGRLAPASTSAPARAPPAATSDDVDEDALFDGEEPRAFVYTLNLTKEMKALAAGAAAVLQDQTGAIAVRVQALVGGVLGFVFKFFLVLMITAF